MPTTFHKFTINAPLEKVFDAVSTPQGLDSWWTKSSAGHPALAEEYQLYFGPGYDWRASVTKFGSGEFELTMNEAMDDWIGTRVGFVLAEDDGTTSVEFYHEGWAEESDHFKISAFCWAMYLRLLRRYVEFGEIVAYEHRNDV